MKLIIDIPDEEYNRIKEWKDSITGYQTSLVLYHAVRNGTPYEERPQGEWIYLGKDEPMKVECPFCHERKCCISNYCDYCGAKMKGGAV